MSHGKWETPTHSVMTIALLFVGWVGVPATRGGSSPALQPEALMAAVPAMQKVPRKWTMEDLLPAVVDLGTGHDWSQGRDLFKKAGCGGCHAFGSESEGGGLAPDLTGVEFEVHPRLHPAVHSRTLGDAQRPVLPHDVHAEETAR